MPEPRSHVDRRSCDAARIPDLPPSKEKFYTLFESTGWNREYQATAEELALAVTNSQHVVAAYDGQQLVGFGRVVTDGVLHAMIYDMIVHPAYQGRSIGAQVLRRLLQWCNNHHIRDIQLFCAQGKRAFYENHGFVARPECNTSQRSCEAGDTYYHPYQQAHPVRL